MTGLAQAERWLLERELFGMRFGLDRMRRLLTVLGSPQEAFRAVHVVGTNGKSSTTRFAAAALGAGAYLSPHLVSFRERIRIGDEDLAPEAFADAIGRVAAAARKVDRTLATGDRVTQFEALTAAAYAEFAARGVEVAVVEAGLGGRWDATNVIDADVVALTNVDLEHTRWLGPTVRDIAREKLAVVRPHATLVVGEGLHPDALDEARATPSRALVVADAHALREADEVRREVGPRSQSGELEEGGDHARRRGLAVRADDVDRAEGALRMVQGREQRPHRRQVVAHAGLAGSGRSRSTCPGASRSSTPRR